MEEEGKPKGPRRRGGAEEAAFVCYWTSARMHPGVGGCLGLVFLDLEEQWAQGKMRGYGGAVGKAPREQRGPPRVYEQRVGPAGVNSWVLNRGCMRSGGPGPLPASRRERTPTYRCIQVACCATSLVIPSLSTGAHPNLRGRRGAAAPGGDSGSSLAPPSASTRRVHVLKMLHFLFSMLPRSQGHARC